MILHHVSHGRAGQDWCDKAAGTYAIGQSTEGQIVIERFRDLEVDAPERLVRARGRRTDKEMLIRFDKATLSYDFLLDGSAASLWPDIRLLQRQFGVRTFTPKDLTMELGIPRPSGHRLLNRLLAAGILRRRGYGDYNFERQIA